ncbi:hypothetical protein B0T14DRAFT_194264 [Immersiella caudata]|uniref:Uncharacterized protein n=1 Tax=Immersiella caudata TaxID=314043 RepID=A0AA40C412_9PEZI|nr:hypothetical protein B0T14DRAFT_194264 [Immersiella caudata]
MHLCGTATRKPSKWGFLTHRLSLGTSAIPNHHNATATETPPQKMDEKGTPQQTQQSSRHRRRLTYAYLFFQSITANILMRFYLHPHLPGHYWVRRALMYAADAVLLVASEKQYHVMAGGSFWRLGWQSRLTFILLPAWIVSLIFGSCVNECPGVRSASMAAPSSMRGGG